MTPRFRFLAGACILATSSVLGTLTARAQTVIDHLPYTITKKGFYVLNSDLSSTQTSGALIEIKASNVTLDFQGHFIAGLQNNSNNDTFGVLANEQSNITVRNGTIAYCLEGVFLYGNGQANTNAVDARVENMRLTYCYYVGVFLNNVPASRITGCQASQIGVGANTVATGIASNGGGILIQDCTVSNLIGDNTYGIYQEANSFARGNTVYKATYGIYGGKYQDNLTTGCTVSVSNGTDAGGNN